MMSVDISGGGSGANPHKTWLFHLSLKSWVYGGIGIV